MRVAFDSVILGAYLHPDAAYPKPVDRVPERLRHFVETLDADRQIVATPRCTASMSCTRMTMMFAGWQRRDGVAVRGGTATSALFPDPGPDSP